MQRNDDDATNRRIGTKAIAAFVILATVAGLAVAASFTPTATIDDDGELGAATTTTNVSVVGSGSDAVLEKAQADGSGTYESQNLTVEHATDRESIRVTTDDVYGGNLTLTALRFNSSGAAWEYVDEKQDVDGNITHSLDISGNDTVKYRLKATFESGAHANLTEWSIGGNDANGFSYTEKTDSNTAFGSATLEDGAAIKTGSDSVDETARIKFDSSNYSTYTGPSYVISDSADREAVAVELSNVSTDVLIAAEYQDSDGNWNEATNATVSSSGTHGLNVTEWDQTKWRLMVQNEPGGHAALTREGIGTSSSDLLGGGGGGSGGGSIGEWWDGLNPGTQGIVIVIAGGVVLIGARKYDVLEE